MARRLLVALLVCSSLAGSAEGARPVRKRPPARKVQGRKVSKPGSRVTPKAVGGAVRVAPASDGGGTLPRVVADPADPREQRIATLRDRLAAALHDAPLRRARVGVEVMSARDGEVLFAHNAAKLFNPASNTKILTTAAALTEMGPEYRYPTALHGPAPDAAGVVPGDVELRGSGDPSLSAKDLVALAEEVAASGVTRIEGAVLADGRYRDAAQPAEAVGDGALILNRNVYAVRVTATSIGRPAVVQVDAPLSGCFSVEAGVTTVKGKRSRVTVDLRRGADDRLIVVVRGRVADGRQVVVKRRLADGAVLAAAILRGALLDAGVEVTGGTRRAGIAGDAPLLAQHRSAPLADICRVSNKDSNNFVADTIFKSLGAARFGIPGTLAKGSRAVGEWLAPRGVDPNAWVIVNGSGLTHANRIHPDGLTRLLRHLYLDLSIAPEFLSSLAVGGVDGTIRNRFLGTSAVGLVRAKTGTLSGVSALSGYVGDSGDVLVFSILVEGFRRRATTPVRHAQVRMVEAMLAFLRAEDPVRAPAAPAQPPPEQLPVEEDSEADGDPVGGGSE